MSVCHLEEGSARSSIFALFGIFVEHHASQWSHDVTLVQLVEHLQSLNVRGTHLIIQTLRVVVQGRQLGVQLALQHFHLTLGVLQLFAVGSILTHQSLVASHF